MTTVLSNLQEANKQAMQMLQDWFVKRCTEEITSAKWEWKVPPKIRDIVASGRLRDSLVVTQTVNGGFTATWTVPYATNVHEGGVDPESGIEYLGRPWTKEPLRELPLVYAQFLKAALTEQMLKSSNTATP